MPEKWTGDIVKKMHLNNISRADMANELGCAPEYVSMVLNSKRRPTDAKERFTNAVNSIIERKKQRGD